MTQAASQWMCWRSLLVITLYGTTLLLVNFGPDWALTFHEVNFAQPAREFLHTGDWITPQLLGTPSWDKPPLMHWLIATSLAVFGTEAEWAARVPTVLATVLTAVFVAILAGRWLGRRIGLLAGLIQLSAIYVFMQGRLAEADMLLCAAVTGAMLALALGVGDRPSGDRPGRWLVVAYFVAAGLAFLAKGPIGLAFVGGGSGAYALVERRRCVWRFLLDPVGWVVLAVCVLGWPLAVVFKDPSALEIWWTHNVERISGELTGGEKDPFFYLYTVAWLVLPWTPFVVSGAVAGVRDRLMPKSLGRLLACWVVVGLVLISLSSWKHKHYAIPVLPPLSIVAALGLERFVFQRRLDSVRALRVGALLLGMGALGVIVLGWVLEAWLVAASALLVALGGLGVGLASTLRQRERPRTALGVVFGTLWLVFVLGESFVMPAFDLYRDQADLARRANALVPVGADCSVVELPDSQIVYYLRLPMHRHDEWEGFVDRLAKASEGGPYYVIGPQKILLPLGEVGTVEVLDRCASVHPKKEAGDRMVAAVVRPEPGRLAAFVQSLDVSTVR